MTTESVDAAGPHAGASHRARWALTLALRAGPSPKTAWERDFGSRARGYTG